jgi:hypothetical protein
MKHLPAGISRPNTAGELQAALEKVIPETERNDSMSWFWMFSDLRCRLQFKTMVKLPAGAIAPGRHLIME